ncbi:MAG TPA: ATP synthase F1 subunit delta [Candidatus Limnocylindrales bacterium]|nr:ATP synthase F1 subunit delta [Candidatus Limnocylindrales bacterium]
MISVTLARRYARALLNLSLNQKALDPALAELQEIAVLARRDPRVRRYFESPGIPRTEKIAFLEKQWKPRLSRPVYGLLVVLLRRRRLDHLIAIADEFQKLAEEAQGITRVVVRTAVPMSEGQAGTLSRTLSTRTGRKILLTREVMPALIGGAVVSLDHQTIDGTLATELWRIRRSLLASRVHGRG